MKAVCRQAFIMHEESAFVSDVSDGPSQQQAVGIITVHHDLQMKTSVNESGTHVGVYHAQGIRLCERSARAP